MGTGNLVQQHRHICRAVKSEPAPDHGIGIGQAQIRKAVEQHRHLLAHHRQLLGQDRDDQQGHPQQHDKQQQQSGKKRDSSGGGKNNKQGGVSGGGGGASKQQPKKQKVEEKPLLPKEEIEKRLARAQKYGTTEGVDELKAMLRKHRFQS